MSVKGTAVALVQDESDVPEELQHGEDGLDDQWGGQDEGGARRGQERETARPGTLLVHGGTPLPNPSVLLGAAGQHAV